MKIFLIQGNKFFENLTGSELINDIIYENHQTFVITPKGVKFLDEYRTFVELVTHFCSQRQRISKFLEYLSNIQKRYHHSLKRNKCNLVDNFYGDNLL